MFDHVIRRPDIWLGNYERNTKKRDLETNETPTATHTSTVRVLNVANTRIIFDATGN